MSHGTDVHLTERLDAYRRFHPEGYGTADTSAADPSEAVEVTVDPTDRLTIVQVLRAEGVRTPERLEEAVAGGYRAAVSRRRATLRGDRPRDHRARARSNRRPPVAVENWMVHGWQPEPATVQMHDFDASDIGEVRGGSDNECVEVELGIASSFGSLSSDPGWLANATAAQIGAAVTQAFAAAYRNRDLS